MKIEDMTNGTRVVVRNTYINRYRQHGDWHGKIKGINNGVAMLEDDFGNRRYFRIDQLESE